MDTVVLMSVLNSPILKSTSGYGPNNITINCSSLNSFEMNLVVSMEATQNHQKMGDAIMVDADIHPMDIDLGTEDYGRTISNGVTFSDFCTNKYMTPAGNQYPLDSCVSHTISASLGALAGLTYDVQSAPKFSTQEMVDCLPIEPGGILYDSGYEYVLKYGLHLEQDYPNLYKYGSPCRCPELQGLRKYSFEGYYVVDPKDVVSALYWHPVSAGIKFYRSFEQYCTPFVSTHDLMGVYTPLEGEEPCLSISGEATDHAILVVGYGYDENNELFYIIKNSWGVEWGVNGYARVAAHLLYHFRIPSIFRTIPPKE